MDTGVARAFRGDRPGGRRRARRLHGSVHFRSVAPQSALPGHTGSQAGFRAFAYLEPATRTVVIAAFNTRNDARPEESTAGFRAVRDAALGVLAR